MQKKPGGSAARRVADTLHGMNTQWPDDKTALVAACGNAEIVLVVTV